MVDQAALAEQAASVPQANLVCQADLVDHATLMRDWKVSKSSFCPFCEILEGVRNVKCLNFSDPLNTSQIKLS